MKNDSLTIKGEISNLSWTDGTITCSKSQKKISGDFVLVRNDGGETTLICCTKKETPCYGAHLPFHVSSSPQHFATLASAI
jgi:hypothetical protein